MDKILSPIKERLLKYLEVRGFSRESFCRTTGISASNFKGIGLKSELGGDKIAKILTSYRDLNPDWLLIGHGNMLVGRVVEKSTVVTYPSVEKDAGGCVSDVAGVYGVSVSGSGMRSVPLYELDVAAGLNTLFRSAGQPVGQVALPDLPPCDGALYVRGDSMYPFLKSGDIVLYKEVSDIARGILWGEMYLLSFEINGEEYISIRYIQRGSDDAFVRLVSQNPLHSPQDIPLANIRALALIKASVRFNTMG